MNGRNLLLDTNAIIALLDGDKIVVELVDNSIIHISFVTELESLSYQSLTPKDKIIIQNLLNDCIIIELNSEIKKLTVELRTKYKLKLPDAIIAATACYYQLPLISADKAFNKVKEIELVQFLD